MSTGDPWLFLGSPIPLPAETRTLSQGYGIPPIWVRVLLLRPSPSIPVRSPSFYTILSYYSEVYSSPSLSIASVLFRLRTILPFLSVSSFQSSTLGSDPTPVSSNLASYCFCYCLAITPISPTPSYSDLLLYSVSYCLMFRSDLIVPLRINYNKL